MHVRRGILVQLVAPRWLKRRQRDAEVRAAASEHRLTRQTAGDQVPVIDGGAPLLVGHNFIFRSVTTFIFPTYILRVYVQFVLVAVKRRIPE